VEDHRQPWLFSHTIQEMVAQRVYGLALGYEDFSDHDQLREDPLPAVLSGKARMGEAPLAGKSTPNCLELGGEQPSPYKKIRYCPEALDELLIQVFREAHSEAPQQIVLDLDTTDLPLEGQQEGRFFHGYYDCYCYLPLYIFAGEHLRCARLRTADIEPQIRQAEQIHQETGKSARVFTEFSYQTTTGSWSRPRRVVAKAEQLDGKENPRFVVTSLGAEE
jgi:hypothetical protein